jgi:hypothetical protein
MIAKIVLRPGFAKGYAEASEMSLSIFRRIIKGTTGLPVGFHILGKKRAQAEPALF